MRTTTHNSEVFVILEGKPVKGTVVEVFSPGAGRIQFGDGSTVQASYSIGGEEGSFHYPDETKAVKASDTFGEPPAAANAEEEPAAGNKKKAGK